MPFVYVTGFLLACQVWTFQAYGQDQPFSSSVEYKSLLKELHHDPSRPTRMSSGTLLSSAQQLPDLTVRETKAALDLDTISWRLEIAKNPWAMALTNKQTGLTWRLENGDSVKPGILWNSVPERATALRLGKIQRIERQGNSWRMQVDIAGSTATVDLDLAVLSATVVRLSIYAPQMDRELQNIALNFEGAGPFFGLGERFNQVKLDGLKSTLYPEDLLGKIGHNWTYIPVPFLFAPGGLGLYLDTAAKSIFDIGHLEQRMFSVQLKDTSIDSYLFIGEPKDIIESYTSLTGRSPIPPPWTFGVWICSYQGPEKVMDEARKLRQNDIPASAIWTYDVMGKGDIMGWPLWWTGYYPDIAKFTEQLHKMGFKALTYVHPYLRSMLDPYNLPNQLFEKGVKSGLFVLNAQGNPTGPAFEPFTDGNIDFTSPANVDWWEQKVRKILLDDNFDGWMEDFGEWIQDTDRFAAGVSGKKMANLNPLFYHKITYEIAKKAKPDVVEFVRSGYAGSQGYTRVVWGGDQFPNWTQDYGLPSVVRAGITAGLSGFATWGPDIAGNGFSKELWTRWVEFGALTPVMRNHLWDKPEGAVNLWSDAQNLDTFRRYAKLHISLFPYFYTYAHQAARTGLPIMRHLLLESPTDPKTYDCNSEYLLGDKILVAPVVEQGASNRSLYLPQGSWVDYWSGRIIEGGTQVTVPAPLEHIPILVRAGSILPFINSDTETLAQDLTGGNYRTLTNDLIWRVFPTSASGRGAFTLYDGTAARVDEDSSSLHVHVDYSPVMRRLEVELPVSRKPRAVRVGQESLNELPESNRSNGETGWRVDPHNRQLHVMFEARDFDLDIER